MIDFLEKQKEQKYLIKSELERLAKSEFRGIKSETKHIWECLLQDGKRQPKDTTVFHAEHIVKWAESLISCAYAYQAYKRELHKNHQVDQLDV